MTWGRAILVISLLLSSLFLIVTKLVYDLAWGIFIPLLCVVNGLLGLAFIWFRHQRAQSKVEIHSASPISDTDFHEQSTSTYASPRAIDRNNLSASTAQREMDVAASAVLAQLNRLTNRPRCDTISNRTTISTTFGVYGEIEPPLPVISPLSDIHTHGQKHKYRPCGLEASLVPMPLKSKSPRTYRPPSSSPYASTRTSYIIEMYAESEQQSETLVEYPVDHKKGTIRSGTPF